MRLIRLMVFLSALVVMLVTGAQDISSSYLAPANQLIFNVVLEGGAIHLLEADMANPGTLRSLEGWTGVFLGDGKIEVKTAASADVKGARYVFDRGRIVEVDDAQGCRKFDYDMARKPPAGTLNPLAIDLETLRRAGQDYAENEYLHKWDDTGRLSFPYVNPNHAGLLYAELFLVFLVVSAMSLRRRVAVSAGVLSAFCGVALIMTMSRGAMLGAVLGGLVVVGVRFEGFFRRKANVIGLLCALIAIGFLFYWFAFDQISRGFNMGSSWSNAIRVEIWNNAARMLFAAPDGWGFCGPGAAYVNWYQPIQVFALTSTLISSQLTELATWGWLGRVVYLSGMSFMLIGSCVVCIKDRNPLALALWLAFSVAAWFNPMGHMFSLWFLPLVSSVFIFMLLVKATTKCRIAVLISSFLVGLLMCLALNAKGWSDARGHEYIRAEKGRISIHGANPHIWIVDDGTLAGGFAGKDIREFYSVEKHAPAVGYVGSVKDLPPDGVDVLVLSGHAGSEWLTLLSNDEHARSQLPKKVIFISPPFSPSCVPEGVVRLCRPKILVGEFAARYDPEYANPPAWVEIVPGMEKYILRWMWKIMGAQ